MVIFGYMSLVPYSVIAQSSVFSLLQDETRKADQLFSSGDYRHALSYYLKRFDKDNTHALEVARCYYYLHNYSEASRWYHRVVTAKNILQDDDILLYAEALTGSGEYDKAMERYQQFISLHPGDELVIRKLWRLKNRSFLYEDSLQFSVRPMDFNSTEGDMAAVPFKDGFAFLSNRTGLSSFERIDELTGEAFYRMVLLKTGTTGRKSQPELFDKDLQARFHNGPFSFFHEDKKLVYTSTDGVASTNTKSRLGFYFAEKSSNGWNMSGAFPFNSSSYSVTEPWISNSGDTLYFASDMPGGFGGKDLYRTIRINGNWSKPENLGEGINTRMNESFPFLHAGTTLYFSSDGHAGIGGSDIFRAAVVPVGFGEVTNAGFPINSKADDFAFTLNRAGDKGYFTSNRLTNQYKDDIFEVEIDQQRYPLLIRGVLRFKEVSWKPGEDLKILANTKLCLIDHTRNSTVVIVSSDADGKFSLNIPYFSQYKIRVVESDGVETIVSLDIPRQKKLDYHHDIVVVRDVYK